MSATIAKVVGWGFVGWFVYSEHQFRKQAKEQGEELMTECIPLTMAQNEEQRQRLIKHNNKYPECKRFKRCNP